MIGLLVKFTRKGLKKKEKAEKSKFYNHTVQRKMPSK